jgi:tungstate transport system substrate-binding protein
MITTLQKNGYFKGVLIFTLLFLTFLLLSGCDDSPETLTLATTTSTENSGLLEEILPHFEEAHNIEVKVVAVGTGAALDMGRGKDADVLLVHALELEEEFVSEGYGTERFPVMYNDFVIIGPPEDPANLLENASDDVLAALTLIWEQQATFISRGDNSGTHVMELDLLEEAGLSPEGDFYVSAGQGMGAVIEMADEMGAYTLTDRGTYLAMAGDLDLQVLTEGDQRLFNPYGVIPVTQDEGENLNLEGAETFAEWITSSEVQEMIGQFGIDQYGEPLFIPDADE